MKSKKIIIGTRGSKLALFQSSLVLNKLTKLYPEYTFLLKKIITKGDKLISEPLESSIEKGFFVKEIQDSLLKGDIDIAVHSLKDLPVDNLPNLINAAILKRSDHRDCFISNNKTPFHELKTNAIIATSSNRRKAQILKLNPGLKVISIRGNVDTRLNKLDNGYCDGMVLASAALERLKLNNRVSNYFDDEQMLNAPGQGAIAVETRSEGAVKDIVASLDHKKTRFCISQERLFLKTLMGGCTSPIGAYCNIENNFIKLKGIVLSFDGKESITKEIKTEYTNSENIGIDLAQLILNSGADKILAETKSL
jgi:hydroxymethylbilane synthase